MSDTDDNGIAYKAFKRLLANVVAHSPIVSRLGLSPIVIKIPAISEYVYAAKRDRAKQKSRQQVKMLRALLLHSKLKQHKRY